MNPLRFFTLLIFTSFSCQESVVKETKIKGFDTINKYNLSKVEKLVEISMEYRKENNIDSWTELNNFIDLFENLVNMVPEGNLVFIEDLITKTDDLIQSNFPEKLDVPDIKSRVKVVKSILLKCKYNSENKNWKDLNISLSELYISYNSLINRITSISDENDIFKIIK
tara:strand:+ start:365 stop:868 length:504 start_codon:yes stop_codon:yes gene_type:complete